MSKKRIVLKIGTSNLSDGEKIQEEVIYKIAECVAHLRDKFHVILVSSGAVASGYTQLHLDKQVLAHKQALASIGQPLLLESYRKCFASFGILSAQILLSGHDFDSRKATQHARDTIEVLLEHNVVPILNENDAIATAELMFGDNDRLSAHIAYYLGAELLVILSDIDGYYDKDPHRFDDARLIPFLNQIPQEKLQTSYDPYGNFATGGIVTKLIAADFLLQKGRAMFLCNGNQLGHLEDFLLRQIQKSGTLFGEFNG